MATSWPEPMPPRRRAWRLRAVRTQRTPDAKAVPLLGTAKISLLQGMVQANYGPVIEAKFELDDSGALSLSVYPVTKGLRTNAEFNNTTEGGCMRTTLTAVLLSLVTLATGARRENLQHRLHNRM